MIVFIGGIFPVYQQLLYQLSSLYIQQDAPRACLVSQPEKQSWLSKLHGPYPAGERSNCTYVSRSIELQGHVCVHGITHQTAASNTASFPALAAYSRTLILGVLGFLLILQIFFPYIKQI